MVILGRFHRFCLVVVMVGILSSCGQLSRISKTQSDYNSDLSFSNYTIANSAINITEDKEEIIDYVLEKRLNSLGYQSHGPSSFIIHYDILPGNPTLPKNKKRVFSMESESLIISFYDPQSQKEIWKGCIPAIEKLNNHQLLAGVNQLLDDFTLLSSNLHASINSPSH